MMSIEKKDLQKYIQKAVSFFDRLSDAYILLICIGVILAGIYITIDTAMIYLNAVQGTPIYSPSGPAAEAVRPDIEDSVAWITIKDTGIDFPVMQGETNEKYLNMDPYGEYSISGSIFLDYRNNPKFDDDYSLIYGHHMFYGVMFGALDAFRDKEYFEAHRTGIITIDDIDYRLETFAVLDTVSEENVVFEPTQHTKKELLTLLKKNAGIYHAPHDGNIIGLSTCADTTSSKRLVVFCTVDKKNPISKQQKEAGE